MKSEEPHNPKYVTGTECEKRQAICSTGVKEEITVIKLALVGKDMRGGLVKDMADVKTTLKGATGFLKNFLLPVATSVIASVIIAWSITNL